MKVHKDVCRRISLRINTPQNPTVREQCNEEDISNYDAGSKGKLEKTA